MKHQCTVDMLRLYKDYGFEQDGPDLRRIYVYKCQECGRRYRAEEVFAYKYVDYFPIKDEG